jgi:fatty-acyl-CoA synthase
VASVVSRHGLGGATLTPFLHGLPIVLKPPMSFLMRKERWLWAIHHFRATLSLAPNFAYQRCVTRVHEPALAGLDLSSWRLAYNGAELVQEGTLREWQEHMGPRGFRAEAMFPVYGMAEAALAVTMPPPRTLPVVDRVCPDRLGRDGVAVPAAASDPRARDIVSVGRALAGYRVRVAGPDGAGLPDRHQGEVLVAGPSLTPGYAGRPELTAQLIRDGWLRTGDLGYVDGDRLFITGREKELIIVGGRNYHPAQIEAAVAGVPRVRPGGGGRGGLARGVSRHRDRRGRGGDGRDRDRARAAARAAARGRGSRHGRGRRPP